MKVVLNISFTTCILWLWQAEQVKSFTTNSVGDPLCFQKEVLPNMLLLHFYFQRQGMKPALFNHFVFLSQIEKRHKLNTVGRRKKKVNRLFIYIYIKVLGLYLQTYIFLQIWGSFCFPCYMYLGLLSVRILYCWLQFYCHLFSFLTESKGIISARWPSGILFSDFLTQQLFPKSVYLRQRTQLCVPLPTPHLLFTTFTCRYISTIILHQSSEVGMEDCPFPLLLAFQIVNITSSLSSTQNFRQQE